ncbi:ABC transporter permease [Elioraea tepidiphila]|uniref:ABC transporter permease n=1 Tax=Elioraea tepidiphila TaxID=457934 RepID=UPI0003713EA2|nr:ABC transporter permease [Elioraea tepidiphila]
MIAASAIAGTRLTPGLALSLLLLAAFAVLIVAPGLVAVQSPYDVDPSRALQAPSAQHLFGTDDVGRDVFARIIHGTRVTLGLVAGSLLLSALIGGGLGVVAGYAGGWFDLAAGRFADMILTFPPIIAGVVITGVLGQGATNLVLALAVVYLPTFFRIARSGALSEAARTYVEAARALGFPEWNILLRQVLPNVLPLVVLQYVILFPLALQIQAALGFLGLGVAPPTPDWGATLEQGKNFILVAWWLSLWPGLFLLASAVAVTVLGRALRDRLGGD